MKDKDEARQEFESMVMRVAQQCLAKPGFFCVDTDGNYLNQDLHRLSLCWFYPPQTLVDDASVSNWEKAKLAMSNGHVFWRPKVLTQLEQRCAQLERELSLLRERHQQRDALSRIQAEEIGKLRRTIWQWANNMKYFVTTGEVK